MISIGCTIPGVASSVASPFVPTSIGGCKIWLRGDLGLTLGTGVAAWANQADASVLASVAQGTGSAQPTTTTLGGQAALAFASASSQELLGAITGSFAQPNTIFAVQRVTSVAALRALFGSTAGTRHAAQVTTTAAVRINAGSNLDSAGAAVTTVEDWVFESVFNGASSAIYKNGTSIMTGNPGSNALAGTLAIGSNAASAFYWEGTIAEVIVYAGDIGAGSRAQVRAYLGARYGITVV